MQRDRENLMGGRDGIHKYGDDVIRPAAEWTPHVHRFLKYLHENGFDGVPYPREICDGQEVVSYVNGDIHTELLPEAVKSDVALISVAKLIKVYHTLGSSYINSLEGDEPWMLPTREPMEVMCHGDLAPYNIAMQGPEAVGIIDFDTLHPGPRVWDIAYALYRWVPLMAPENPECFGTLKDQKRRLQLFLDTYGELANERSQILDSVIRRLNALIDYMEMEAAVGNNEVKKHIAKGHLNGYRRDIANIEENREGLMA